MLTAIGFTGPTGAGKTTALRVLEEMGGRTLDCDKEYHRLLETSQPLRDQLTEHFGADIAPEGVIDRKALAAKAFASPQALEVLNGITLPFVAEQVKAFLAEAEAEGIAFAGIDAPTLFESGLNRICHYTVAVTAPAQVRLQRVMNREGVSREYAQQRIDGQHSEMWYWQRCTFILLNNADYKTFRKRSRALLEYLVSLTEQKNREV